MQGRSGKAGVITSASEAGLDVVGVEHGVLGDLAQAVGAVAQHVG